MATAGSSRASSPSLATSPTPPPSASPLRQRAAHPYPAPEPREPRLGAAAPLLSAAGDGRIVRGEGVPPARDNLPTDRRRLPWWEGGERPAAGVGAAPPSMSGGAAPMDLDLSGFASPDRWGAAAGVPPPQARRAAASGGGVGGVPPPPLFAAAGADPVLDREEMVARMLRLNQKMAAEVAALR